MLLPLTKQYSLKIEKFQIVILKNDKPYLYYNTLEYTVKQLVRLNIASDITIESIKDFNNFVLATEKKLFETLRKNFDIPLTYSEQVIKDRQEGKPTVSKRAIVKRSLTAKRKSVAKRRKK